MPKVGRVSSRRTRFTVQSERQLIAQLRREKEIDRGRERGRMRGASLNSHTRLRALRVSRNKFRAYDIKLILIEIYFAAPQMNSMDNLRKNVTKSRDRVFD